MGVRPGGEPLFFLIRDARAVTANVDPARAAFAEEDNQ